MKGGGAGQGFSGIASILRVGIVINNIRFNMIFGFYNKNPRKGGKHICDMTPDQSYCNVGRRIFQNAFFSKGIFL